MSIRPLVLSFDLKKYDQFFCFFVIPASSSGTKDEDDKIDAVFPSTRPSFLSDKHFLFLSRYFNLDNPYRPEWMRAYKGFTIEEVEGVNGVFEQKPDTPVSTHLFNEFVLQAQVITTAAKAWLRQVQGM